MDEVVIDACCMINLYAAGDLHNRLTSRGQKWYVPSVVIRESLFIHQLQPDGSTARIPIDLQSLVDDGALTACDASEGAELDLYVDFASQIDDGEAMALAIAKSRRWTVATDDRKAIRLATEHAITVVTTPDLMKSWADNVRPTEMELQQIILRIESQATFFPASRHHLYEWWNKSAGRV